MLEEGKNYLLTEECLLEELKITRYTLRCILKASPSLRQIAIGKERLYWSADVIAWAKAQHTEDYEPILSTPSYNRPG